MQSALKLKGFNYETIKTQDAQISVARAGIRSRIKSLRVLVSVLISFLVISCANVEYYQEEVSSVMISVDNSRLIAVGKDYHYLFNTANPLAESLKSGFREHLSVKIPKPFKVHELGKTIGYINLIVSNKATKAQKIEARNLGFTANDDGSLYFSMQVMGKRFPLNDLKLEPVVKLKGSYQIDVRDSEAMHNQMLILTPVILAGSTAFLVANPAMLITTIPVIGLKP